MSSEKAHVEHCKGVNGLDKVILREIRGCSAEVFPFILSLFIDLSIAFSYPIILVSVFGNGMLVVTLVRNLQISVKMLAAL